MFPQHLDQTFPLFSLTCAVILYGQRIQLIIFGVVVFRTIKASIGMSYQVLFYFISTWDFFFGCCFTHICKNKNKGNIKPKASNLIKSKLLIIHSELQ